MLKVISVKRLVAPRSDAKHSFLPRNCSAAWPGSDARQPEPLASRALLHGVRSCTSSPELPPVAYEIDAVAPTLFGCCQRRWSVGSGGAENTNWRTQVFRAILERQCVLESERGSACLTRETRKQRGVVGVRLGPPHQMRVHHDYFLSNHDPTARDLRPL